MAFRKIFFGFLLLIFGDWCYCQSDSTDFNFYSSEPILLSFQDSVLYEDGATTVLNVQFDLTESQNFGRLIAEIILFDSDSNAYSMAFVEYSLDELETNDLIQNDQVNLVFKNVTIGAWYQLAVRIEDLEGHQTLSITKNLTL